MQLNVIHSSWQRCLRATKLFKPLRGVSEKVGKPQGVFGNCQSCTMGILQSGMLGAAFVACLKFCCIFKMHFPTGYAVGCCSFPLLLFNPHSHTCLCHSKGSESRQQHRRGLGMGLRWSWSRGWSSLLHFFFLAVCDLMRDFFGSCPWAAAAVAAAAFAYRMHHRAARSK